MKAIRKRPEAVREFPVTCPLEELVSGEVGTRAGLGALAVALHAGVRRPDYR